MSSSSEKALAAIFEGPSDDEEFLGFGDASSKQFSEESQDSVFSQTSWKLDHCFKSKFITHELAKIFMDTDSEGEFEGFSKDEGSLRNTWMSPLSSESEEDTDDIGFYSDDEQGPQTRRTSGLCVAFRFPARKSSAQERRSSKKFSSPTKNSASPINNRPLNKCRKRLGGRTSVPVPLKTMKVAKWSEEASDSSGEEDEVTKADAQILSQRAKNIQENKAMLAKLFADLSALPELPQKTTPVKKRKQQNPKKHVPDVQSERRNPSRRARPPEHFGVEQELVTVKPKKSVELDLKKLLEVDEDLRERRLSPKRKYRKRSSVRMPDDITEEELDNVADRAKDKILDKENGSTCHQCRQKTLDTKTECRNPYCQGVKGQFCGPCLRNRYGEDVRTALLDPLWECPLCRGICNCSLCRKKDGRCATGALTHLAKYNGYDNVKEYLESLQKNLD